MTTTPPDGGPAFPIPLALNGNGVNVAQEILSYEGMSLRAYIATAALQGMLSDQMRGGTVETYAMNAVQFADALIAALNKPK